MFITTYKNTRGSSQGHLAHPRKHICTCEKVALERANEAWLCSNNLKRRPCVCKSVALLLHCANNTTPHRPHTSILKNMCLLSSHCCL